MDLLVAGRALPGPRAPRPLPAPDSCGRSPDDPDLISLADLVRVKLSAGRRQDLADVMKLLARLDEAGYREVEASLPVSLRSEALSLREEGLEELSWERA